MKHSLSHRHTHTPQQKAYLHTERHRDSHRVFRNQVTKYGTGLSRTMWPLSDNSETRPHSTGQKCPILCGLVWEWDRSVLYYVARFRNIREEATWYGTDLSRTMSLAFGNSETSPGDSPVPCHVALFVCLCVRRSVCLCVCKYECFLLVDVRECLMIIP